MRERVWFEVMSITNKSCLSGKKTHQIETRKLRVGKRDREKEMSSSEPSSSSAILLRGNKRNKHQLVSRLLSRVVLPLILFLFVADIVFYETNETKLQREATREERRVGSHRVDVHSHSSSSSSSSFGSSASASDSSRRAFVVTFLKFLNFFQVQRQLILVLI